VNALSTRPGGPGVSGCPLPFGTASGIDLAGGVNSRERARRGNETSSSNRIGWDARLGKALEDGRATKCTSHFNATLYAPVGNFMEAHAAVRPLSFADGRCGDPPVATERPAGLFLRGTCRRLSATRMSQCALIQTTTTHRKPGV